MKSDSKMFFPQGAKT